MRIACLFIPHFAVAVERLHRPELRSQPVIIGGSPEERKDVLDCSSEALRRGIRIGMPLREALSRCREAAFLEARHVLYQETAKAMNDALGLISPDVEPADLGQVFVGLHGLERLALTLGKCRGAWPCAPTVGIRGHAPLPQSDAESLLASDMLQAVKQATQLTPKIGIADGKFVALVAAITSVENKPHIVASGDTPSFLAELPVTYLPVTLDMQRRLRLFGLRTLRQLAALPLGAVQAQFGPEGRRAWELANGIDNSPLIPQKPATTLKEKLDLPALVTSVESLLVAARHLITRVTNRPEFARHAARGLAFRATLADGNVWERRLVFREPIVGQDRIFSILKSKLENVALPAAVEEVEVELLDICGESGTQGNLFASQRGLQLSRIDEAIRQLKSAYGRTLLARIVEVEPWSRIPERRFALIDYDP
ncbi:MAG: DNA polymerase Y family protein [Chloroflexota bacterium]